MRAKGYVARRTDLTRIRRRPTQVHVRDVVLNSQPKTVNRPLRGCAAESAGEWRGDVGSDDLFGWFVGQFLGGRRADAGRRIDQAAVVDDLFDL